MIYVDQPHPVVPERRSNKGRAPSRLKSTQPAQTVAAWTAARPAEAWRRLPLREGEKGEIVADFLHARIFVWDGIETTLRNLFLIVPFTEADGEEAGSSLARVRQTRPTALCRRNGRRRTAA
jgi:hypothetical protein